MADFIGSGWGPYISIVTIVSIVFCLWLALTMARGKAPGQQVGTTGHSWDEDLAELNNPLPRWWLGLFVLTIIFGLGYLWLYPGLGTNAGSLGWSQAEQYEREVRQFNAVTDPLYAKFLSQDLAQVATSAGTRHWRAALSHLLRAVSLRRRARRKGLSQPCRHRLALGRRARCHQDHHSRRSAGHDATHGAGGWILRRRRKSCALCDVTFRRRS